MVVPVVVLLSSLAWNPFPCADTLVVAVEVRVLQQEGSIDGVGFRGICQFFHALFHDSILRDDDELTWSVAQYEVVIFVDVDVLLAVRFEDVEAEALILQCKAPLRAVHIHILTQEVVVSTIADAAVDSHGAALSVRSECQVETHLVQDTTCAVVVTGGHLLVCLSVDDVVFASVKLNVPVSLLEVGDSILQVVDDSLYLSVVVPLAVDSKLCSCESLLECFLTLGLVLVGNQSLCLGYESLQLGLMGSIQILGKNLCGHTLQLYDMPVG